MERKKAERRITILTNTKTGKEFYFYSQAKAGLWLGHSDGYITRRLKDDCRGYKCVDGIYEWYDIRVSEREYACYLGDELEMIGTKKEIKKHFNIDDKRFFWHKTPSAHKRGKKKALIICEVDCEEMEGNEFSE